MAMLGGTLGASPSGIAPARAGARRLSLARRPPSLSRGLPPQHKPLSPPASSACSRRRATLVRATAGAEGDDGEAAARTSSDAADKPASFPTTLSSSATPDDEALAASIAAGAPVPRVSPAAAPAPVAAEAAAPLALAARDPADADAALVAPGSSSNEDDDEPTAVQRFLFPDKEELPGDFEMPIWDHLEELRERVLVASLATAAAIGACFAASKELVLFLEAPVADAGVRFLQLSPGEFFFTTFKVAGYCGLLLAAPTVIYEVIAYVVPGLTKSERRFLAPVVLGSSLLFYAGLAFSYEVLTPAALNFFVSYAEGAVESLWSIDQYFSFVLVLMLSTGLSFQVPVVQVLLGQLGLVSSAQMLGLWRYVVVGATVAAAVLTPSTDPFTQALLAIPLVGLYMGGAGMVRLLEGKRDEAGAATR